MGRRLKLKLKRRLCILPAVCFILMGMMYYKVRDSLPDRLVIGAGTQELDLLQDRPEAFWEEQVVPTIGNDSVKLPENAVQIKIENASSNAGSNTRSYVAEYKFLGILGLKSVQVDVVEEQEVYPGGFPVGIYVETDGVMVIGTGKIVGIDGMEYEPAKNILQSGDYITAINGKQISTKEQFIDVIDQEGENPVILQVRRKNQTSRVKIMPVKTGEEEYRIGTWIRDNTQGVGMLTYATKDGEFGALGHGITDIDTGILMDIHDGRLLDSEIVSIVKGKKGTPGELVGMIDYSGEFDIGTVSNNTENGIFGKIDENVLCNMPNKAVQVGYKQEMQIGPAEILTCVDGKIQQYDIEILEIDYNSDEKNKSFLIEITDQDLLNKTGGIVQGMSGSPIIQDGKLVGAVTHVLVNDPTRGYGIFIENMLEH